MYARLHTHTHPKRKLTKEKHPPRTRLASGIRPYIRTRTPPHPKRKLTKKLPLAPSFFSPIQNPTPPILHTQRKKYKRKKKFFEKLVVYWKDLLNFAVLITESSLMSKADRATKNFENFFVKFQVWHRFCNS